MRKVFKGILSFGLAIAVCVGASALYGAAEYTAVEAATDYYSSITATEGNSLLGQLHDLITTTHTYYTSYGECSESKYVHVTDPGPDGGALEFYTQESIMSYSGTPGTWNREHVWCKSLSNGMWKSVSNGSRNGGTDMHHIRPAESGLNSTRGSYKFGEVNGGKEAYSKNTSNQNVTLGGYIGGSAFEPLDKVKGDVARIVMYVYTHYNTYSNVYGTTNGSGGAFGTLSFTNIMTASNEAAAKKLLLQWNALDPVDSIETTRNDAVYKIQGNRNPFIDHPEYAEAIWGDGTVIDPNPNPGPDPQPSGTLKSLTLNATSLTLTVGQSHILTVSPSPSSASASVVWTSSDASVATVADGVVTAKAAGTVTITATSTSNPAINVSATVRVLQPSSPDTNSEKTTVTRDSFTNASSSYSFWTWTTKEKINGIAYVYGGTEDCMQFTNKQPSYYLASTTPTPRPIRSVTVKSKEGKSQSDRDWQLLTSDTAYGQVKGVPENGKDWGTKTVTSDGVTWTVDGNDTYFALAYILEDAQGAAYLDSIEVVYGSGESSETPLESLAINPSAFTLKKGGSANLSAIGVPSGESEEVIWTSSDPSVATVSADGTVTAKAGGTATITATSKKNSAITATATVTVTAAPANTGNARIDAFYDALAQIDGSSSFAARHDAIVTAIEAFHGLTGAEKAECADGVETLQSEIASYNAAVAAYNGAAFWANEAAWKSAGKLL